MRPRRSVLRPRSVLLLLAVTALLGVVPAAAQEPLRMLDVSPSDQRVTVVVDVPGSETAGTPSPEFEVLDGESRLPVEMEPVLQPRRSFTVVVDAAGAGSATRLGELTRTATDLLLRVGTTVEPALVISRATSPDVLPPVGVVAAVDVLEDLRPGARTQDALVPAVRAALGGGGDGSSGLRVVLVLAASEGDVAPARLREELSGQQALVHVLTVGAAAQRYWREVVPEVAGEVVVGGSGPGTGSVVRRMASQHVVSFRRPRSEGSVVLSARTRDGVLAGPIDLGSARAPTEDRGPGSTQVVAVVLAVLALSLVSVGLLAVMARDRQRGSPPRSGHAGAGPPAAQRLRRPSTPRSAGRHHRGARGALPDGEHRGGRGAASALAPTGHDAGKHVRGREDVRPAPGPSNLVAGSGSQPGLDPAPAPGSATPSAEAPTGAARSGDGPSPWPSRWALPPAVPKQRSAVPAPDPGPAAAPDSARPSDEGPGRD